MIHPIEAGWVRINDALSREERRQGRRRRRGRKEKRGAGVLEVRRGDEKLIIDLMA